MCRFWRRVILTQPITRRDDNKARRACRYFGAAFQCVRQCTLADNILIDWYPCARPRISDEARGRSSHAGLISVYFMHYRVCAPFHSFPGQVELSLIDERRVMPPRFASHSQSCSRYEQQLHTRSSLSLPRIVVSVFVSFLVPFCNLSRMYAHLCIVYVLLYIIYVWISYKISDEFHMYFFLIRSNIFIFKASNTHTHFTLYHFK